MIILFLLKFQRHLLCVMDKLKEDIMQIKKLNVKLSIFVAVMEMEALLNIVFSVLMVQFSNKNI